MADVKFEVARKSTNHAGTPTVGTTMDITISGFGTPKAAIVILTAGISDGTISQNGVMSIGYTDGTNQVCTAGQSADNVGTMATGRRHANDRVAMVPSGASGSELLGISFDSWVTDGIRLKFETLTWSNRLVTVVLIGGDDVAEAHAGYHDDLGTGSSAVDITSVGFESDLVFMSCVGLATAPTAGSVYNLLSFGVGHNDGSDTQRATLFGSDDNTTNSVVTGYISTNSIVGQVHNNALQWRGVIGDYDADGFSVTPVTNAGSDVIFYLCLKFNNDPDVSLFSTGWPSSGNKNETAPGFEPGFGLISALAGVHAYDTAYSSSSALAALN